MSRQTYIVPSLATEADIDFDNSALAVRRTLQETHEGVSFKEPKTTKSRRLVAISNREISALLAHRDDQQREKDMLGKGYDDSDLDCAQADGKPVIPINLTRCFADILVKAKLQHIRFHDLRHTHATILLSQNIHPKIVSERLGRFTIGITLDTYTATFSRVCRPMLFANSTMRLTPLWTKRSRRSSLHTPSWSHPRVDSKSRQIPSNPI